MFRKAKYYLAVYVDGKLECTRKSHSAHKRDVVTNAALQRYPNAEFVYYNLGEIAHANWNAMPTESKRGSIEKVVQNNNIEHWLNMTYATANILARKHFNKDAIHLTRNEIESIYSKRSA